MEEIAKAIIEVIEKIGANARCDEGFPLEETPDLWVFGDYPDKSAIEVMVLFDEGVYTTRCSFYDPENNELFRKMSSGVEKLEEVIKEVTKCIIEMESIRKFA